MKIYIVMKEIWRDSKEPDAIAYDIAKVFSTKEKAEKYIKEECEKEDWAYIEAKTVL